MTGEALPRQSCSRSVDRERVRGLLAAALKGEEYSVIEMAHDLEHAMNVNERMATALDQIAALLGDGRINWEPNYPEVQQALRTAQEKGL